MKDSRGFIVCYRCNTRGYQECRCYSLRCLAMGVEELEESSKRLFVTGIKSLLLGRVTVLFSSYEWAEEMEECGDYLLADGLIAYDGLG